MNTQHERKVSIWLTCNTEAHKLDGELKSNAGEGVNFSFNRDVDTTEERMSIFPVSRQSEAQFAQLIK